MAHTYTQGDEPVPGSGYRLTSFLGRGGFGEVWKATAPGGAEAALKIIRLGGLEGRKEFRALQLVKRVRHPNLVPIIAFWLKGKDGSILDDAVTGQDYLSRDETQSAPLRATMVAPPDLGRPQASELILAMGLGDLSLFDRLEQCRAQGLEGIPPEELHRYMEDVAEAIDFLNSPVHEMGSGPAAIQHCDIKPHNLMIVGGAAQICDFGLARMMGADRATTAASTIAYAAPECLQDGQPSSSTDQYSLAVTYYELRTGVLPYQNETLAAVMAAKEQEKLDYTRVPPGEQAVLRHATLRDPAKRFPSAAVMVKALRDAESASPASTRETESRPAIRFIRRLAASLAVAALLAGLAFGGWFLWNNRGGHPPNGGKQAGVVGQTKEIPPPPPPGTEKADALAERGDWSGAIAAYSELIEGNGPTNIKAKAYFGRGRCQLQSSRFGQAINDFESAVRLDPVNAQDFKRRKEYVQAYFDRGMRHLQDKQPDRAIPDLQRVIELTPEDALALSALGQAWLATNEYEKAAGQLSAALALRKTAEDLTARAGAYLKLDRRKEAKADLDEAVRLDDANVQAHFLRATGLMTDKDYTAAASEFEKVMSLDPQGDAGKESRPKYADACLELGFSALKKSDYDNAIPYFDRAAKYNPGEALIFVRRAGAWYGKGEFAKAVEDLSTSIRLKDNDADHVARGQTYREMGNLEKAMADFTEAIGLNPQNARALAYRGCEYMAKFDKSGASDDLDLATADLNQAVEICRKTPNGQFPLENALLFRADCYRMARKPESAAKDFAELLGLAPKRVKHTQLDELAADFAKEGKLAEAAEWEEKAIELAPDEQTKAAYQSRLKEYRPAKKSSSAPAP